MAQNPLFRVIHFEHGAELDNDSRKQLEAYAKSKNIQLWLEFVVSEPQSGFHITGGQILGQEKAEEEAADAGPDTKK